jgi:hypothetical protein
MKAVVTISRHWDNPKIMTTLSTEGISLQTDLVDFIEALAQEIGPITWVFTDKKFREKLNQAVITVTEKIKEESIKAI